MHLWEYLIVEDILSFNKNSVVVMLKPDLFSVSTACQNIIFICK